MQNVFARLCVIAHALVRALAISVGLDETVLAKQCDEGDSISLMRLFYYHPDDGTRGRCLGSSPHTDWGFLTLILQDSTGLQFKYNGDWHNVPHINNSLVVNCGDYLALLTQGRYHSPVHRVLCPTVDRVSFVFFFYPNYDSSMASATSTEVAADAEQFNTLLDLPARAGSFESPSMCLGDSIV
jgi:isopenicillin N synthase-like dioxygenase